MSVLGQHVSARTNDDDFCDWKKQNDRAADGLLAAIRPDLGIGSDSDISMNIKNEFAAGSMKIFVSGCERRAIFAPWSWRLSGLDSWAECQEVGAVFSGGCDRRRH
jgi:hypothetical protein